MTTVSPDRRFPAAPTLEVIRASDDTVRAELIALPVPRSGTTGPAAFGAAARALRGLDDPRPAA